MADERLVDVCWTFEDEAFAPLSRPAAMRVEVGGPCTIRFFAASRETGAPARIRGGGWRSAFFGETLCCAASTSLAVTARARWPAAAVSSERAMRSTSAKGYGGQSTFAATRPSARQPSRGLPTEAHAYVGKRERSVGEPPTNRTDGEADALPRIGLLPSSRHGSTTGCRERFGVALSSVGGDLNSFMSMLTERAPHFRAACFLSCATSTVRDAVFERSRWRRGSVECPAAKVRNRIVTLGRVPVWPAALESCGAAPESIHTTALVGN